MLLIKDVNEVLTAPVSITSQGASVVPLTIKGASGQSSDLQQWVGSTGTVLASITNNGSIRGAYLSNLAANAAYIDLTALSSVLFATLNAGVQPIIVKGAASQTASLQEWQDSTGAVLTSIDKLGRIASPNIEAVTATMGAAAGTSPPPAVIGTSNDVRGNITFGTGTSVGTGVLLTVNFPTAYTAAPVIAITPSNSAARGLGLYIGTVTTSGFQVSCTTAPSASQANTTYSFHYIVIG